MSKPRGSHLCSWGAQVDRNQIGHTTTTFSGSSVPRSSQIPQSGVNQNGLPSPVPISEEESNMRNVPSFLGCR